MADGWFPITRSLASNLNLAWRSRLIRDVQFAGNDISPSSHHWILCTYKTASMCRVIIYQVGVEVGNKKKIACVLPELLCDVRALSFQIQTRVLVYYQDKTAHISLRRRSFVTSAYWKLLAGMIPQGSFPVPRWSYRSRGIIVQKPSCLGLRTAKENDKLLEASKTKSFCDVHRKLEGSSLATTSTGLGSLIPPESKCLS